MKIEIEVFNDKPSVVRIADTTSNVQNAKLLGVFEYLVNKIAGHLGESMSVEEITDIAAKEFLTVDVHIECTCNKCQAALAETN